MSGEPLPSSCICAPTGPVVGIPLRGKYFGVAEGVEVALFGLFTVVVATDFKDASVPIVYVMLRHFISQFNASWPTRCPTRAWIGFPVLKLHAAAPIPRRY